METRAKRSIVASPAGLKRLEEKRRMSGKTAKIIGDLAGVSRSSAQKFFNGQPVSVENFRSLCEVLELSWEEIVGLEEIASSTSSRKRVAFVIQGSLDDLDPTKLAKLQAMVRVLQQLTGDASITTVDIEEGSIQLILEGSKEGIERLKQLFDEGKLAEALSVSVRTVEQIEPSVLNTEEPKDDALKVLLVATIRFQGAMGSNLSGADLRGADLSYAKFRGADLRGADLRGADLRGAKLSNTDLSGADLRGADFRDAKLTKVNLSGALGVNLRGAKLTKVNLNDAFLISTNRGSANLGSAIAENIQFGKGIGLNEDENVT